MTPYRLAVGNIPYDATEEQLKEKFSEAGPVISFRCVCALFCFSSTASSPILP